jgi:hypothetical protein
MEAKKETDQKSFSSASVHQTELFSEPFPLDLKLVGRCEEYNPK